MNTLLMLPIRVGGTPWGLVELYEMRLRRFGEDDIAVAQFLVAQAERRLETGRQTSDDRKPATAGLRAADADPRGRRRARVRGRHSAARRREAGIARSVRRRTPTPSTSKA